MRPHRTAAAPLALTLTVLALLAAPAPGLAQEARYTLGEDLFAAGGDLRLVGPAGGDLFAAGGSLDIAAGGARDLIAAGGTITVDGSLRDDAILAGGTVTLAGTVAEDVIASGGRLRLLRGARIGGDALLTGGSITLDGDIAGDVALSGGTLRVAGRIGGDVDASGGRLEILAGADIAGAVRFEGREPPEVHPGARIGGGIEHIAGRGRDGGWDRHRSWGFDWGGAVFGALSTIVVGAIVFLLLPGLTLGAAAAVRERPVFSLLVGIALLAGVPLLAVLLFATVIGIPLGVIALLLFPPLLFLAIVATAFGLSEAIMRRRLTSPTPLRRLGTFALIVIGLYIVFALPWIGGLAGFVALLVGLGAVGQSLFTARRDSIAAG